MTKCLFCGAYCEVRCGVYCEGYPGSPEEGEENRENVLGCTQVGTTYICDVCLAELKNALGIG